MASQMVQVDMVVTIDDLDLFCCSVEYLDRFDSLSIFGEARCRCMFREYKAVNDKSSVVGVVAKVSPISIIFLSFGIFGPQAL